MNWFERYAIPGIYFVLLLTAFYWIIFGFPSDKETIVAVFVAVASASVPAGYILSIISQRIYYWFSPWQLQSKSWRQAGRKQSESKIMSEEIVEAEVAVVGRWKIKNGEVDKGRWLQEWFTKRMDVLAVNSALILATIMGCLLGLLGFFFRKPTPTTYLWILFGISGFIIFWLILSTNLLNKQVRHALVIFYTELRKINGKATSPNSG